MHWSLNILLFFTVRIFVEGAPSILIKRAVGDPVDTTSGRVTGQAASVASQVSEYLGIRYAEPVGGSLRWAPPKRVSKTGSISGSQYVRIHLIQPIEQSNLTVYSLRNIPYKYYKNVCAYVAI